MDLRRGSHKEQLFLEKQRFPTPGGRNSGGNPDKPQGHTRARTALSPDGTESSVRWYLSHWNGKLFVSLNLF